MSDLPQPEDSENLNKENLQRNDQDSKELDSDFQERAKWIKGRQIFARRPKRAREVINLLLSRKGYNQVQSNENLQAQWEAVLDSTMKGKTRATGIRSGKLEVIVQSAVVNQELTFIKNNLLAKIKDSQIGKRIKDIRFRIGEV